MVKRRRWGRAVVCCLVMGALASCGGAEGKVYEGLVERTPTAPAKPADEVRGERLSGESMELLRNAESLRIGLEMTTAARGREDISVHLDRRGNCTATFDSGPARKGDMIVVGGGAVYFRFSNETLDAVGDEASAGAPELRQRARERIALARGKYVKVPKKGGSSQGQASGALTKLCDLRSMLDQVAGAGGTDTDGGVRALPDKEWHGRQVTPLVPTEGEGGMTAYLATGDEPYIVGATQTTDDEQVEMRMSDYDKPVAARAPDPSLVIDMEALGMGAGGGTLFEV
ncbi:hypothetical protein [Streptomyces sp. Je 1-332]|uniref:hypothetical protein n=1 Tax=Streptomyces sp. Je 1-332 TaxID=3231270 RepID=UPI00345B2316